MSDPITMDDLAYEGFPEQFVNEHGDIHDDCVVMEYLGVTDTDKQELAEGDVAIQQPGLTGHRWMVVWDSVHAAFCFVCPIGMNLIGEQPFKIIGNILETPDIMVAND